MTQSEKKQGVVAPFHRKGASSEIMLVGLTNKDSLSRLGRYVRWVDSNGRQWMLPNLAEYRDNLLENGLTAASVQAHLSTIRSRYREIVLQRQLFFDQTPTDLDFVTRKAMVDEVIARIEAAINPRVARVDVIETQDVPDSERLWLTHEKAREFLSLPDRGSLVGIRDMAVIATLLCTGVREAELCALQVSDLQQKLEGERALQVRKGKGSKRRLIPLGKMNWCLPIVNSWLNRAKITDGPVFRGLRKGERIRKEALNERTIQKILARYPVMIDGVMRIVRPHDCRRTYARWMYYGGMRVDALRKNMGHESVEMTFYYIGDPDVADRTPPAIFNFDLIEL